MKPFFSACLPYGDYSFDLEEASVPIGTVTIASSLANPLYYLADSASPYSVLGALAAALTVLGGTYSVTFSLSDKLGVRGSINKSGGGAFEITCTTSNYEWLGFQSAVNASVLGAVATDMQPLGTWFPKTYLVNLDDWQPVARQGGTSELTADGSAFGVTQDDNISRQWLLVTLANIHGARMKYRRSIAPASRPWWSNAGLVASLSGDATAQSFALDAPSGWWFWTSTGATNFVVTLDETDAVAGNQEIHFGQVVYSSTSPVSMDAWKSLDSPCVIKRTNADGASDIVICFRVI